MSHDLFDQIYLSLCQRLRRRPQSTAAEIVEAPAGFRLKSAVFESITLRSQLTSSHSAGDPAEERRAINDNKPRSASQPSLRRHRYIRGMQPAQRMPIPMPMPAWKTELGTQPEEPRSVELSDGPSPSELEGSCPASPRPFDVNPELGRTESMTTSSTSTSNGRSHYSRVSRPPALLSHPELESAYPEPVILSDRPFLARSPNDYEQSYPEVIIDPISSIHEDNMSLFSDSGSIPVTMRSTSKVASQKRFNLFKSTKRGFSIPVMRFFASARHMIAWTKHGGVCFDVSNPDNAKTQPINSSDIVLGAGGTCKYCIIARCQEVSRPSFSYSSAD